MGLIYKVHLNCYSDDSFSTASLIGSWDNFFMCIAVGNTAGVNRTEITNNLSYAINRVNQGESGFLGYTLIRPTQKLYNNMNPVTWFPACEGIVQPLFETNCWIEYVFENGYKMRSRANMATTSTMNWDFLNSDDESLLPSGTKLMPAIWSPRWNIKNTDESSFSRIDALVVSELNSDGTIPSNAVFCAYETYQYYDKRIYFSTSQPSANMVQTLRDFFNAIGQYVAEYNITYHLVHATGDASNPTSVPVETAEHVDQFFRFYPEAGYELKYGTVPIGTGYGPDDSVIRVWNAERGEMIVRGFTSDITIEVIGVGSPYPIPGSDDSGETHPGSDSYDMTSDPPPTHNVPSWDTTQAGFINVYVPDAAGLNRLANYLWAGSFDPDNLRKLFANPMDVILGCHILPVAVPTADNPVPLAVGNVSTGISMPVASSNWVQYDCGTLNIPVFYEAYMSFAPYTKVQLYLPFCGTYEIDPDIVMGREMGVVYNIDVLTGACVVDVSARSADEEGGTIYYQFTGNCAAELPVTSGDYKNILQVLQSAAVAGIGIIGGAAGGGALGAAGTVAAGVGQVASSITDMVKPNVSHSGSVSGNAGYMGLPMPYVTIITPRLCKPDNQNEYIGLPIYATAALGEMAGYTVVDSIHLEGFSCTDEELNELETMLHEGVIF